MERDQVRAAFDQLAEPLFTAMECISGPFTINPLRKAIHDTDDCVKDGRFERPGREYAEYANTSVFDEQWPTGERGKASVSGPLPFAREGDGVDDSEGPCRRDCADVGTCHSHSFVNATGRRAWSAGRLQFERSLGFIERPDAHDAAVNKLAQRCCTGVERIRQSRTS